MGAVAQRLDVLDRPEHFSKARGFTTARSWIAGGRTVDWRGSTGLKGNAGLTIYPQHRFLREGLVGGGTNRFQVGGAVAITGRIKQNDQPRRFSYQGAVIDSAIKDNAS
jgi:hypothetical protein